MRNELPDFVQFGRRVVHKKRVRAWVGSGSSALGKDVLILVGDQRLNIGRFCVRQLEAFGTQRLEFGNLLARLQRQFLLGRKLVRRCNQHHVAALAFREALGLQDNVEGLIPWHIFQPQRKAATDGIAGNDIEAGEIGDHLQNGAHFDVLKIQ